MDYLLYAITKSGLARDITQENATIFSLEYFNSLFISLLDSYIDQSETDIFPKYVVIFYAKLQRSKQSAAEEAWKLWDSLQYFIQRAVPEAMLLHKLLQDNHTREDIIFARKVISIIIKHEYGYTDKSAHTLYQLNINAASISAIFNKLSECDSVIAKANSTSLVSNIVNKVNQSNNK